MKAHVLAAALCALALVSTSFATPPTLQYLPADGQPHAAHALPHWEPFSANPAYEVFGAEDAQGVFRYTASRLKAPTVNYGVKLPSAGEMPPRMALGNDPEMARALMARPAAAAHPSGVPAMGATAKSKSPCGHSDCDGGQCKRKPRPKPDPPVDVEVSIWNRHHFEPIHYLFAALAVLVGFVVFVLFWTFVIVVLIWAVKKVARAASAPTTPPANPQ